METPVEKPNVVVDLNERISTIEGLLGSDPAQANARASLLLRDVPGHQMAMLLQGIALRLMGTHEPAIGVLRSVCRTSPNAPLAHLQLGLCLIESGDKAAALRSMRRAVEVKADFSDAWLALANLLTETGDRSGADQAFGAYIRQARNNPYLLKAGDALGEGRTADAESLLREQLDHQPNDVAAMCMLADVIDRAPDRQDRLGEAETILRRCLDLAPGYARARHNYAVVLLRQYKALEALKETDRLLSDEPKNTDFRKLRAAILVRLREYGGSIEVCEQLLDDDPDQPTVWTSLGHMLKSIGRRDDCVEAYRKAIALAPWFGEPYWSLANLKTFQVSDNELESIRKQLENQALPDADKTHFHFAMGKALEDRNKFEESFQHYSEGSLLRLKDNPYDAGELSDHVSSSKNLFTPEFFADRASFGASAQDPIFILGLPRSGSTLVEQILASHSDVEGTMELTDIVAIAKTLAERDSAAARSKYPEVLVNLRPDEFRELGESYIERTRIQRKMGTRFFIDKLPNNFAHVGLIHLILPNARIIDVRRHPLACGLSLFKEHFARAQNFSYSLDDIGQYYCSYAELMGHFDIVLPGRVHRIIYESLVDDTEAEVRRLLEYCGLPFEESCLNFHQNKRSVSTASSEQVRKPIFRSGLDHWKKFEPWLGPLKERLGPLVDTYSQETKLN